MCISHSYRCFDTPTFSQYPRMSYRNTSSIQMSLVTGILHILTNKRPVRKSAYIEIRIMPVYSYKCSSEALTEPISNLRLYSPMPQTSAIIRLPGIIIHRNIQCPFACQSKLQTEIHGSSSIIQKIAFQSYLLGFTLESNASQHKYYEYNNFLHYILHL